jgi:hypothetical protein
LIDAAEHTSRIMLRGLDYCPPVDLSYADYARAIMRADEVAYPLDERGYRKMVGNILRKRRIVKSGKDLEVTYKARNSRFRKYDIDAFSATPTNAYRFLDANREELSIPREANFSMANLYRTRKVSSLRYYPPREVVLEFVWSEDVVLRGRRFGSLNGNVMPLWCGGTLVCDSNGNVLHYVLKPSTPERVTRLSDYVAYLVENQVLGMDDGEEGLGARARGAAQVTASVRDGRVYLRRNAALRHTNRKRGEQ